MGCLLEKGGGLYAELPRQDHCSEKWPHSRYALSDIVFVVVSEAQTNKIAQVTFT
jgi:hypothetical protein